MATNPETQNRLRAGGHAGSVGEVVSSPTGDERIVVPLVEETVTVGKRSVDRGGVRITKTVQTREEQVPVSLRQEKVSVERVPIGQFVDTPTAPRQEGDTLIVPVFEEVVVTRIFLKEELRITRTTETVQETHSVTLKREQVHVEHLDPTVADGDSAASAV